MKEPKIRFKGFSGEWKSRSLKEKEFIIVAGGDIDKQSIRQHGKYPVIANALTNDGIVGYYENNYRIEAPAVSVTGRGEIGHAQARKTSFTPVVRLLSIKSNHDVDFLANAINCKKVVQESTGVPQLTTDKLSQYEIAFPKKIEEEKAIGVYISSLDSLIQSTTKKIESLKQVKAASLQSMFPQEGETTPRVRFKGFEGEWKSRRFSELYVRSTIKNDLSFNADKIISVANMYFIKSERKVDEDYLKSYNVMRLGDIAFEGHPSKDYAHGRFVENAIGDGIVSHIFVVMKPISPEYDVDFWKYYINNEDVMGGKLVRCTKSSTMMNDLVVDDFLKETILVPSYEEQVKIGKVLASLDKQITLQTQRLEKLKQIKAACLDKMFV